ncbi:MAG: histidine kinase dimerization/phosphoacceptor domain -containing protein [bacterium]
MKPSPHPLQVQRLNALHSFEILDTDNEKDFDDIVKLASAICGTPISVISLVDADRQWFKAEVGLGLRETPIELSICAHAILDAEFMEIKDTTQDDRVADNPLVAVDKGLRFYAAAALTTEDDLPIGTLCVLDYEPKELTPLQRDTLKVLARQVMTQLEMRKALHTANLLRQEVDHRMKNSLQSLSALIRVQSRSLTTPEAKTALASIKSRLDAVATLHELLYKTEAGANVDLGKYIQTICDHLSNITASGVTITARTLSVSVSTKQAVAVGTLINEFIANSLKHAFPDQTAARSRLCCRRLKMAWSGSSVRTTASASPKAGACARAGWA